MHYLTVILGSGSPYTVSAVKGVYGKGKIKDERKSLKSLLNRNLNGWVSLRDMFGRHLIQADQ